MATEKKPKKEFRVGFLCDDESLSFTRSLWKKTKNLLEKNMKNMVAWEEGEVYEATFFVVYRVPVDQTKKYIPPKGDDIVSIVSATAYEDKRKASCVVRAAKLDFLVAGHYLNNPYYCHDDICFLMQMGFGGYIIGNAYDDVPDEQNGWFGKWRGHNWYLGNARKDCNVLAALMKIGKLLDNNPSYPEHFGEVKEWCIKRLGKEYVRESSGEISLEGAENFSRNVVQVLDAPDRPY
ncbi:MAG: hypothetical protein OXU73_01755 [Candidatus Campbellbacteria bacterium]|nr:hypothetical protein [Candidatus Campbellbacteria bacterium]